MWIVVTVDGGNDCHDSQDARCKIEKAVTVGAVQDERPDRVVGRPELEDQRGLSSLWYHRHIRVVPRIS
mgnify:FL=1|jgi:hypothetical protein